jgi:hypothetical protein
MLVVMQSHATQDEVAQVLEAIQRMNLTPHPMPGATRTAIGITGNVGAVDPRTLEILPGVMELIRVTKPYKLASREMHEEDTYIEIRNPISEIRNVHTIIGPKSFTIIAGPCSVENETIISRTAEFLSERGVRLMRAGAFKPRSSPYAFQGLGNLEPSSSAHRDRHRHRVDGYRQRRRGRRSGRHNPDRHAQHAEFQSAATRGQIGQAGFAQTRHVGHIGRMAHGR